MSVHQIRKPAGDEYWMWQEQTAEGWGLIVAYVPMLGLPGPLVARDRRIAHEVMAPIARQHVATSGNPLRCAHFVIVSAEEFPSV